MKRLFAAAAVAPLCLAASQVQAQTSISTATTAPIATSTTGDTTVTAAGSITVTSGTAVTIDSNNTLTVEGAVVARDTPNGTAIKVDVPAGGRTSTIILNGAVAADDTVANVDPDSDGDPDGPFAAAGTQRYGLQIAGPGVFTGNITQSATGVVVVKGNAGSSGIIVDSDLVGSVKLKGNVVVVGTDSFGLHVTKSVTGDIVSSGGITARGEGTVAIATDGPITGQLKIDSEILSTGYRYTTRFGTAEQRLKLDADDLLLGGPAVRVRGSISKGLLFYAPPGNIDAADTDEDDDGILDTEQTLTARISHYGSAPAILIGDTANITLGNVGVGPRGEFGIAMRGTIVADGVFDGISAAAMKIGGLGGTVDTSGGVNIRGGLFANAYLANATALHLGAGAQVPLVLVDGAVSASALGSAAVTPVTRGIQIDLGATVPTLTVLGAISATVTGPTGSATAVLDSSGTLKTIRNEGRIAATLGSTETTLASGSAVALDLRQNTTGVTYTQAQSAITPTLPQLQGDILFGTGGGSDTLNLNAGLILGNVVFGGGTDTFTLSGGSGFLGGLSKGSGSLALDIAAGVVSLTNVNAVQLSSLNVGATSSLLFTANPEATDPALRNGRFNVSGAAVLAGGSKINLGFSSRLSGPESFTIIEAASLTNLGVDSSLLGSTPFIYTATLRTTATSAIVDVTRRTKEQLGLSGGRAAAFDAFYEAFGNDPDTLFAVFSKTDQAGFNTLYNQFLPDYSGGVFQSVALGARGIMQAQADEPRDMSPGEPRSWLQEIGIGISQDSTTEITYRSNGFGLAGGYEVPFGARGGVIGLSAAFTSSDVRDQGRTFGSLLAVNSFMAGGYWRDRVGGVLLDASVNAGYAWVDSNREVISETAGGVRNLQRTANADWSGVVGSARFGASYNYDIGPYFFRPDVILDYIYLSESGYTETGGGNAVNLQVDSRRTYEAGAEAGITLGARWGRSFRWGPELRIAYRTTLAGGLSETTARFVGAPTAFTLSSIGADESRMIIRAALRGSGAYSNVALEAGGEIGDDYSAYLARLVIRFLF